ncbi:sensor histidine kinase [Planctobacterium marinum]|uniref:Signal transduction histidine kinase internal region domain-containing protein n=1 Tax=Planctobacterium marinum TaxID=1631968 RepID=A0AA48HJU5_9ALTE|nr:hypothetical protein MACH26_15770 [Planctobacterium marinum]
MAISNILQNSEMRFSQRLLAPMLWKLCAIYWLITLCGYSLRRVRYFNDWTFSTFWQYFAEGMQWWAGNFLVMPFLIAAACYISLKNDSKVIKLLYILLLIPFVFCLQTSLGVHALYLINNFIPGPEALNLTSILRAFHHYTAYNWWNLDFQMYLLYLLIGFGWQWYETGVLAQLQHEKLNRQLVQSELAAFRAQLNPHFLFNVLNSISALVRTERKPDALNALNELSLLLRGIIDNRLSNFSTLEAELSLLDNFIYMQKLRFGEKLTFNKTISKEAYNQRVPGMLLLPLIENAVVHGSKTRCNITLEAEVTNQGLYIRISNPLDEHPNNTGFGMGIGNNKARLALIYGETCQFEQFIKAGHFIVEMTIPTMSETERL